MVSSTKNGPLTIVNCLNHYSYETNVGPKECIVISDGSPGSLWGAIHDEVLGLCVPDEVRLINFSDDVAVIVILKHSEDLKPFLRSNCGCGWENCI